MQQLKIVTSINAPVAEVWGIIGAVGGVDKWSPIINTCTLSSSADGGLQRTCSSDKGDLKERILVLNHDERKLTYAITEQQFFPIDDLVTAITVSENEGSTQILTEITYSLREGAPTAQIESGIKEVYAMSYTGIEQLISQTV
ncbi:MAG: SRPBCC family protein [Bacteroidota bacterium]